MPVGCAGTRVVFASRLAGPGLVKAAAISQAVPCHGPFYIPTQTRVNVGRKTRGVFASKWSLQIPTFLRHFRLKIQLGPHVRWKPKNLAEYKDHLSTSPHFE